MLTTVATASLNAANPAWLGAAWAAANTAAAAAAASGRTKHMSTAMPLGPWPRAAPTVLPASLAPLHRRLYATATPASAAPQTTPAPSAPPGAAAPLGAHPGSALVGGPRGGGTGFAASPFAVPRPGSTPVEFTTVPADVSATMGYPVYDSKYVESIHPSHLQPERAYQKVALKFIQATRWAFDKASGYSETSMTEAQWLRRIIFLETVAGVPGMVAGMLRHLKSLRRMQADGAWINTLLQEAENERMHLLTFLTLRDPGPLFRGAVILAQGVFFNAYFLAYLVSPRTCHAAVGYLEEEAVKTYTHALREIDAGRLWPNAPAPAIAKEYWRLGADATMRDLILAVRADEASHSHVNHTYSQLRQDAPNPFGRDDHRVGA